MTRIQIVAPPFAGHLHPVLALGKRLAADGFDVGVLTGPAKIDLVRQCGFDATPIAADDPEAMERIAAPPHQLTGHPLRLLRQLRHNLDFLVRIRPEVEEHFARIQPDLVLADFCAPVAGWVAEARNVPWITTIPTPLALETRHGTPTYLGGWKPPEGPLGRLRDHLGRLGTRFGKRLSERVFRDQFRALGVSVYRDDGTEAAYSSLAILGLGVLELEFERDWPAAFRMIGPVTENPEPSPICPDLPPGPTSLVTIGTHLSWARSRLLQDLQPLFQAFPEHHFVIALGQFEGAQESPIERGSNWSVFPWIPYDECLEHFQVVLHHGGTGIAYSALRAGLPALVCPHDYDQFDFATRLAEAGCGLVARRWSSPTAIESFGRLLAGEGIERRRLVTEAVHRSRPFEATRIIVEAALEGRPIPRAPAELGVA